MMKYTACKNCKHRVVVGPGTSGVWYNNYCGVSPCGNHFDAIEGAMVPNNNPPFKYCINVNTGNCRLYEPLPEEVLRNRGTE